MNSEPSVGRLTGNRRTVGRAPAGATVTARAAGRGRMAGAVRLGIRQFLADNPPLVLLTAVAPRPVVQYLFFVVLSRVLVGPGYAGLALTGGPALALVQVAVMIKEVPLTDKSSGTFYRIRLGRPRPFLVMVARALPYPVAGFLMLTACVLVVPPLAGHASLTLMLLAELPLYALMAFTTCACGLAAALLALGRRAEVLTSNLLGYLIMLCCGIFLPASKVPFADVIGRLLPVRNGLIAVRAAVSGQPWLRPALAEALVGVCWLAAGFLIMQVQIRNGRRNGRDDYG